MVNFFEKLEIKKVTTTKTLINLIKLNSMKNKEERVKIIIKCIK